MKCRLMGLMGLEAAEAIVKTLELPIEPKEYMTASQEIMSQLFSTCQLLSGQLSIQITNARHSLSWYTGSVVVISRISRLFSMFFRFNTPTDSQARSKVPHYFLICFSLYPRPFFPHTKASDVISITKIHWLTKRRE